jgi:diacylglycerol kinase (ATP)
MYKRARLIYNPTSGRELAKKNLADILIALEKAGYEASTYATKGKGDATKEAKEASKKGFDLIVAAGGDGTIYEIINGLAQQEKRPKLAILPLGTTNDFARAIGVPKNLTKALELISENKTKKVDVGKMNHRYFINIAGGGALTELTYETPIALKTALGQLAYYIKGIEKLPSLRPFTLTIEANGKKWNEEVLLFLVANSNSVGGFERLAPGARIDDGLFDVFVLKKCNIADLARVMTLLMRGEHIHDTKVLHFQTDKLNVSTPDEILINLDGELGGTTPCEFELLKNHIEIIVGK